jgi:hypothetical protein
VAGRPRKYPKGYLLIPPRFFRWREARGEPSPTVLGIQTEYLVVSRNDEWLGHLLDDCHHWSEDTSGECPWPVRASATSTADSIYRQIEAKPR